MIQYIAYSGQKFIIEWYFNNISYSQAFDYFSKQPKKIQDKTVALFKLMADRGKIFDITKFRNEGDNIYAFKVQQDRYLAFFFKDRKIIITNAFFKKTEKLPIREKNKAINNREEYIERINKGQYYEKEH